MASLPRILLLVMGSRLRPRPFGGGVALPDLVLQRELLLRREDELVAADQGEVGDDHREPDDHADDALRIDRVCELEEQRDERR